MSPLFLLLLCSGALGSLRLKFESKFEIEDVDELWEPEKTFFIEEKDRPLTVEDMRARIMDVKFVLNQTWLPMSYEFDFDDSEIPESFDARQKWSNCPSIGTIYNQAACGSCWAFCTAETMSDRTCIATSQRVVLSPEDVLTCCGSNCGFGCQGGYPTEALKFWTRWGVCTGGPYGSKGNCKPYSFPPGSQSSVTPPCRRSCQSGYGKSYNEDKHYGSSAYTLPRNVAAIQKEIMTNGPVSSTYLVYSDFFHYNGGVYRHTSGSLAGGHCVKTIGWGVDNGTPYWLVANSWGAKWGENGFFRILRGTNEVRFEQGMAAGLARR